MIRRANLSLLNAFLRFRYPFPKHSSTPHSSIPTSSFRSSPAIASAAHFHVPRCPRSYSTGGGESSSDQEVDAINLKFAEAREEIEMALESKDTVYFDEEAECARAAVNEVLSRFEGLLTRLPEKERGALQRSMGLKIEQLKAELQQLDD